MIDYDKLKNNLNKIDKKNKKMFDPLRGLTGKLRKKVLALMAGHRSGVLTAEEEAEINKIQSKYKNL